MSNAQNASGDEQSTDETPMIPEELTPGQKSEDPVPDDPEASGDEGGEDDDRIDLNDLA